MKPIKRIGKSFLAARLEKQVLRLRQKNEMTVIAVAGSVGKTSTKLAIAELLLACGAKVRFQDGNYNDRLTIPLIFFNETEPSIFDIPAWLRLLGRVKKVAAQQYEYTHVVVELGTDAPGQMEQFAYLQPEIGVLTAIAAEHMQYFKTLAAVAAEELQIANYAQQLLINIDDVDTMYLPKKYLSYAADQSADYQAKLISGSTISLQFNEQLAQQVTSLYLGKQGAKIVVAATAVATLCGFNMEMIVAAVSKLQPAAGRLQTLAGNQGSLILDDTYNASPIAVTAALAVLATRPEAHKIAILGTMNELGDDSQTAHEAIGKVAAKSKLELLITIGQPANDFLASTAEANGCRVLRCVSPVAAGQAALQLANKDTVILVKGSQNRVFAEEAVKVLLENPIDATKLVRQSAYWMSVKRAQFSDIAA